MKFPMPKTTRGLRRTKRDYSEASTCAGKVRHEEWASAEAAVQRIVHENIAAGTPAKSNGLSTYRCPYCWSWHVGHSRVPVQINAPNPHPAPYAAPPKKEMTSDVG